MRLRRTTDPRCRGEACLARRRPLLLAALLVLPLAGFLVLAQRSVSAPTQAEPAAVSEPFEKHLCYSCHVEHGADDNVFTQFYPVLRRLKGSG